MMLCSDRRRVGRPFYLVDSGAIDAWIEIYRDQVGPKLGARVVARAWNDAAYKARLLADGTAALKELGIQGWAVGHLKVVAAAVEPGEYPLLGQGDWYQRVCSAALYCYAEGPSRCPRPLIIDRLREPPGSARLW
jgi:hypothetical protein